MKYKKVKKMLALTLAGTMALSNGALTTMAKQNDDELDDIEMMSLELDDGTNLECEIVATFDVEDTSYIALLPVEAPEGYDDDEVLVYRYIELPNDEFTLEPIDDEEEFDMVADAFDEILDEMEFNSMSEDD